MDPSIDCPFEYWNGGKGKAVLFDAYADWLESLSDWKSFITLTFRDPVSEETADKKFRFLVRSLNVELFGKHYTRIVKHSYFGYIRSVEYQSREVLHYHLLTDVPVNFHRIHKIWNSIAGICDCQVIKTRTSVIRYVIKYAVKQGDIKVYIPQALRIPKEKPEWWV
jgi:hypothetical protein